MAFEHTPFQEVVKFGLSTSSTFAGSVVFSIGRRGTLIVLFKQCRQPLNREQLPLLAGEEQVLDNLDSIVGLKVPANVE